MYIAKNFQEPLYTKIQLSIKTMNSPVNDMHVSKLSAY